MRADVNLALFLGAVVLSVLLLSVVESGRVTGVSSPGLAKDVGLNVVGGTIQRTRVIITTVSTIKEGGGTTTEVTNSTTALTSMPAPASGGFDVLSSSWLVVALAASLVLIGALYLRLPTRSGAAVDLEADFTEMHEQLAKVGQEADYKVRNAALLRYYALVRKVCSKTGLVDGKSETPKEYISRISSKLRVDPAGAQSFATAVNEAMYGVELAPERAQGLSRFMGSFAEDIRRALIAN